MRIVGILMCLAVLAGAAWHLSMRGTDQKMLLGAPQIQNIVDTEVRSAIAPIATHPVEVETDGRNVRLSGPVNSEAEHQEILRAARTARFLSTLDDALRVLPKADPFLFQAVKKLDGGIVLTGHVPSNQVHEDLLAQARIQSETAVISDRLVLAAGAPDGDWPGMASAGLTMLEYLREGQIQIAGTQALVSGAAVDVEAAQWLVSAVNAAPLGEWQVQIEGALPVANAYAFSALKIEDGSVIVDGNAPDEDVLADLLEAAGKISTEPVSGTLELADGMPSQEWPDTIKAGLVALDEAITGMLKVSGGVVSLTAEVDTDDDLARLLPMLGDAWQTDISVRNPTPDARLELTLTPDGTLTATGLLPQGTDPEVIRIALPDADLAGIEPDQRGRPADWSAPLDGLQIVMPRFKTANAVLSADVIAVSGTLRRGFSADGLEAALKNAVERDWMLDLDLIESAPLAELILSKQAEGIVISGVLPVGLDATQALLLLGDTASGEGLSGGGEGDALTWVQALEATKLGLDRFADTTGRITERQIDLTGRLLPGYPAADLQDWMSERLPEDWGIGLSAEEIAPSEGDQRISLKNGEAQNFRQGYWLPNVDFAVSTAECGVQIENMLSQESIEFVTGSARIDQKGRILLNRLAAVAVRCLNSSVLQLQIEGHTDSVGNDENNLTLSQERADAVRTALQDRGVRGDAMQALGFGEAEPIATNDTAEGRAQNRRIAFSWSKRTN